MYIVELELSSILFLSIVVGSLALIFLNLYGRTKSMRFTQFDSTPIEFFRFGREKPLSCKLAFEGIGKLKNISCDIEYAQKATSLINSSLAHLEWYSIDPIKTYQTVPIWENPILFTLGKYSGLPHYKRYNFTNYRRTIERGFGICGDASMVLSQLLKKRGISHNIIAFDEHVLVEAYFGTQIFVLDPDFGICIDQSLSILGKNKSLTFNEYRAAGFPDSDATLMANILSREYFSYNSVYNFVPKRYILERLSYYVYWYLPLISLIAAMYSLFDL